MKPLTREWVEKAEGDFAIMERESRVRKKPSYDGICFHAQQCAEKYLKARLCEVGVEFAKIHDLVALLDQLLGVEPQWEIHREDLAYLSDFSVAFRYPGESADRESALDARRRCRRFREAARTALEILPLPLPPASRSPRAGSASRKS
jgi:HEPN domain-containing protein